MVTSGWDSKTKLQVAWLSIIVSALAVVFFVIFPTMGAGAPFAVKPVQTVTETELTTTDPTSAQTPESSTGVISGSQDSAALSTPQPQSNLPAVSYTMESRTIPQATEHGTQVKDSVWDYPVFSANDPTYASAVAAINSDITGYLDEIEAKNTAQNDDGTYQEANFPSIFEVSYLDDSTVSVHIMHGWTGWGAHGSKEQHNRIYDLQTGELVRPWDYMNTSIDGLSNLTKDAMRAFLSEHPGVAKSSDLAVKSCEYDDEFPEKFPDRFYVSDKGLIYSTDNYDFGGYGSTVDFVVSPAGEGSYAGQDVSPDTQTAF